VKQPVKSSTKLIGKYLLQLPIRLDCSGTTTSTESSDFFTNHAGKIWADIENDVTGAFYYKFIENSLQDGDLFLIEYSHWEQDSSL
jgi:hypothetical protein